MSARCPLCTRSRPNFVIARQPADLAFIARLLSLETHAIFQPPSQKAQAHHKMSQNPPKAVFCGAARATIAELDGPLAIVVASAVVESVVGSA
jgi:hypothetical protein